NLRARPSRAHSSQGLGQRSIRAESLPPGSVLNFSRERGRESSRRHCEATDDDASAADSKSTDSFRENTALALERDRLLRRFYRLDESRDDLQVQIPPSPWLPWSLRKRPSATAQPD